MKKRNLHYPESHFRGALSIENASVIMEQDLEDCDFGLQVASDGRVWVCIDGIAFLRFKPAEDLEHLFPGGLQGARR